MIRTWQAVRGAAVPATEMGAMKADALEDTVATITTATAKLHMTKCSWLR